MRQVLLAAAAAALASPASAAVVYTNNFDTENGGNSALNYNGFTGLTVTDGTVDLIRSGAFGPVCAGAVGSCVDLDGSTGNAGLTSSGSYAFAAGERVALTFKFSGNQRGGANDAFRTRFDFLGTESGTYGMNSMTQGLVNFGSFNSGAINLTVSDIESSLSMRELTFFFVPDTAGSFNFSFQDLGNDNVGVVLDDVSLAIGAVPEPSAWAMLILGFGVIGAAARRRRAANAFA